MSDESRNDDDLDPTALPETETHGPSGTSGERIGPYRLLDKLGEGGMGEVWLAEQQEPVRRKVALKVIKQGMDTKQVVARFEAEKQALALMDHPAIAKVYDAGATPRGRPYFAMEHVEGVPITEHCDRHRLSNRERLALFMQVCDGVQHAHQKAVIHRDLKPSNVLVSIRDDRPAPKIIDFGVAKATAQKLTEETLHTQLGVMIGTPAYMSPEQAEMTGQGIDTRTDVYALGVMLYELLVGALPFDMKQLQEGGYQEMVRRIREDEPSKPSTRLTTLGEHSTQSAKKRKTELPALKRELSGDLDWITLKALEKDRTRRYGSPHDLAADIERYLTDQPVLASPPSAAYRAKKFFRRHTWGVAAAAIGVLTLIAFAGTMAVQAKRIATERDLAQQAQADLESVVEFQAGMLSATDPEEMGRRLMDNLSGRVAEVHRSGGSSEAQVAAAVASLGTLVGGVNATDLALDLVDQDILAAAVKTLDEKFGDQPTIDARLRGTIGVTYRRLGRYEPAEPQLEQALETRRRVHGADHPDTLASMNNLANLYLNQGRYAEAEPLYLETLETERRVLGADHPETLRSTNNLALLYWNQGRYAEAEPLYLETLETKKRVHGADHPDTLRSMNNLANLYLGQGRYAEAEPLYVETLETHERVLGEDHPDTLSSMHNLASLYVNQGRHDDAEPLYLETLETRKRVLGDDHPDTLRSMNNLAALYVYQGRYAEAEPLYLETLETQKRALGADHPHTLNTMGNLAALYVNQGRHAEAETLLLETLETQRRVLGDGRIETVVTVHNLACVHRDTGRLDESRAGFERVQRFCDADLAPAHGFTLANLEEHAKLLRKTGDEAGAERLETRARVLRGE